jgi:hypothetical protein
MVRGASSSSSSKPNRSAQVSCPAFKRSKSLPRLPSHPLQPAEVKTAREPISRPGPDTRTPMEFRDAGGKDKRAEAKFAYMGKGQEQSGMWELFESATERTSEYMQLVESIHPKIRRYNVHDAADAHQATLQSHPRFLAGMAKLRNEENAIPNYPTSTRLMDPQEQRFLTRAMQRIREEAEKKPFHIHGESGVVGNAHGDITWFGHVFANSIEVPLQSGDKYTIHSHPPFAEPFTSSASEADHQHAAASYLRDNLGINEYVTNGRDVLHIQPDSLELVKLVPVPIVEKSAGKFPEAFRIPEPRKPPYPFSNHEAPAAFKQGWEPPAGLIPPPNYPRD